MTAKADGDKIDVPDVEAALAAIGHSLRPLDIVLLRTGRDAYYGQADHSLRGCAVTPAATRWLYDQGVRVWASTPGAGTDRLIGRPKRRSRGRSRGLLGSPSVRPAVLAGRAASGMLWSSRTRAQTRRDCKRCFTIGRTSIR